MTFHSISREQTCSRTTTNTQSITARPIGTRCTTLGYKKQHCRLRKINRAAFPHLLTAQCDETNGLNRLRYLIESPVLFATTKTWRWPKAVRVGLILIVAACSLAASYAVPHSYVRAVMFLVGMLLAESLSSARFVQFLTARGEIFAIAVFVAGLVYCYLLDVRPAFFSSLPGWWSGRSVIPGVISYQGPYKTLVLSITGFWLCAFALAYDGLLRRAFSWTPLRYLGNISYSYYLIHGVSLQGFALLSRTFVPQISGVALYAFALTCGFATTVVSATVLFLTVEKPTAFKNSQAMTEDLLKKRKINA